MALYTITGKTDGFGSQYHAVMSGVAICAKYNAVYLHTPFVKMEHGEDVDELNRFIGIPASRSQECISEKFSGEVHYSDRPSLYYTPSVLQTLRSWYYSTEKPKIQSPDIAIHIRRGDVTKSDHPGRFTENTFYVNVMKRLKEFYPTYSILIFSEGSLADFAEFQLPPQCFKLSTNIKETFHSLVKAKILVMSKSSFSYAAAILNENSVYYEEFWHKPLDGWLKSSMLLA
jgi:hypothetical protein